MNPPPHSSIELAGSRFGEHARARRGIPRRIQSFGPFHAIHLQTMTSSLRHRPFDIALPTTIVPIFTKMTTPKTLIIGISGPSCSGKTTITRLLHQNLAPLTTLLHQDDFYVPDNQIPIVTLPNGDTVADWDCRGSLDIPKLVKALQTFRTTGSLEGAKTIQDQQAPGTINVDETLIKQITERVNSAVKSFGDLRILLVDGFLLLGGSVPELRAELDVRILLAARHEDVKKRREERKSYVTQDGFWEDPPGYVDNIVWPNYVAEHRFLFVDGDVEGHYDVGTIKASGIDVCPHEAVVSLDRMTRWVGQEILRAIETLKSIS
jgi:nicotinamide/nicotinate riboside kinase